MAVVPELIKPIDDLIEAVAIVQATSTGRVEQVDMVDLIYPALFLSQHRERCGQVATQRIACDGEMGVGRQLAATSQAVEPFHHVADLAEGPAVIVNGVVGAAVADVIFDEFGAAEGDDVFGIRTWGFEQRTAESGVGVGLLGDDDPVGLKSVYFLIGEYRRVFISFFQRNFKRLTTNHHALK
ncbi:hypothetical protein ACQE3E_17600 [Methylomonas sp. MED-D]|uniref:hypothetical protein n=1 Tax=Methylomonas sp. MED-D TaxID=3418768 RepID=UPI003D033339